MYRNVLGTYWKGKKLKQTNKQTQCTKILAGHWTVKLDRQNGGLLQSAVVRVCKPNFASFCCGQPFVYQVWLFSGRSEFFTCSYCAWLWNWLINLTSSNLLFLRFARKLSGKNYFPFDLLIITATRTKLWKLLLRAAICIPSLIVQRSARMFHFSSLRMIVKLAFVRFKDLSLKCEKWTGFWQL